jgi:hypothetical protein
MIKWSHGGSVVFAIVGKLHGDYKGHDCRHSSYRLFANGESGGKDDGGQPKRDGGLAEKDWQHYDKQALSSKAMRVSEDDKWYISDAASCSLPALIAQLAPPSAPGPKAIAYAKHVTTLAQLIGVQMLVGRENMLAAIAKNNEEKADDNG